MTARTEFDTSLFDTEFFALVRGTTLPFRSDRSSNTGIQAVRRLGESLEFAELRPYQPGDDFRLVDWNAYRRFSRILVRRYQAERSRDLFVVLDASASMAVPTDKFRRARKIAGAVAVVGAQRNDRVALVTFDQTVRDTSLHNRRDPFATDVLARLSRLRADGQTDLVESLSAAAERVRRGSTLVLVSDFLAGAAVEGALARLQRNHVSVLFVHISAATDRVPPVHAGATPVDVETGDETSFAGSPWQLDAHIRDYDEHVQRVRDIVHSSGGTYAVVDIEKPFSETYLDLVQPAGEL